MTDANAFLRRILLVAGISALSMVNVAYAHGGGKGTGGSSGGGSTSSGSSSSSGHSASSTSSGHSATSTTSGHSATASTASKGTHPADPAQGGTNTHTFQEGRLHVFVQPGHGSGYNSQNTPTANEDRRKHQRLFLGFIRY